MQLPIWTPKTDWELPKMAELPSWKNAKRIAIDTETRDDHLKELGIGTRRGGYMVGASFAIEDGPAYYLPVLHGSGQNLPRSSVLKYLKDQAKVFEGEYVGAHLSYDLDYWFAEGIRFNSKVRFRDIQIADPLIYELQKSYSLENIALRYNLPGKNEELLEEAAKAFGVDPKSGLWKIPPEYVGPYAIGDVERPLQILRKQERIIDDRNLWDIWNLETDVLPVLVHMRQRGIRIDEKKLEEIEEWSLIEESKLFRQIKAKIGINLGTEDLWKAKALAPVFEAIGVKLSKTPTGQPEINKDVFKKIDHPIIKALGKARKVNKLRTTFAASIRRYMVKGRIHCTFNQITQENTIGDQRGVRFGRLSATDPNLQQQPNPKRDEIANEWRKIYLPEEGSVWACNDYCFSDDTEILTWEGFKLFKDLNPGHEHIAQWKDGVISYDKPYAYQRKPYKGNMIHVKGDKQVDLLMSPNHNCILQTQSGKILRFHAKDYAEKRGYQIQAGEYQEEIGIENPDLLRVVVAIQADGAVRGTTYRIWLKKPYKVERLREILQGTDLEWHETYSEKKAAGFGFVIRKCPEISKYLTEDKTFKRETFMVLCLESRNIFLDELEHWDGSLAKHTYGSTNKDNVELAQQLGVMTNRRCNLVHWAIPSKKEYWFTTLTKRCRTWTEKFKVESIPYDGELFCVTMPQSTVIVRRNGKVSITGQSQQEPRWTTHFATVLGLPEAQNMAEAYHNDPNLDNHQFMSELTGLERTKAKDLYLGLCYGEGGAKLCEALKLPTRWALASGKWGNRRLEHFETKKKASDARRKLPRGGFVWRVAGEKGQKIIDQFNAKAPFIGLLAKAVQKRGEQRGFIITGGGRQLHFPQNSDGTYDWTHKALNRLIQGTSADQTKKALVEIDRAGYWLNLQVHDETDSSVGTQREAEEIGEIMRTTMEAKVPFKVDVETGPNWGEAE